MVFNIVVFFLGALIGGVLNRLILQLPLEKPVAFSYCNNCSSLGHWKYKIPLVSFILLKAQCPSCKEKLSIQTFCVELLTASLSLLLFINSQINWAFPILLLLFYVLIVLAFIDLKYKAVPDYLLLSALLLSFIVTPFDLLEALKNACIFAGAFALLEFVMTFYIQNVKARLNKDESLVEQRALGEGDIPVLALIAVLLGLYPAMVAIFLAAFFAIIPALFLKNRGSEIPFIPYLLLGLVIEYLFEISRIII